MVRVQTEPLLAYVLHTRPYRDTSVLADFLTAELGLVRAVVKGVRRLSGKASAVRCEPFTPLNLSFTGRGSLKSAWQLEAIGAPLGLKGKHLFAAMYVNELLLRALHEGDPYPDLVRAYQWVLGELEQGADIEASLRPFEHSLLNEMGYGIDLYHDVNGEPLVAAERYCFQPEMGFVPGEARGLTWSGAELAHLGEWNLTDQQTRRHAKQLLRQALLPLVGDKPLVSRELFSGASHND
ncbi:MAG: DNA repair protein RecO [Pseudomonadales bacterium]